MVTNSSVLPNTRIATLRTIVLGGLVIGIGHEILQAWLVFSVIQKTPFMVVEQYVASGLLGEAAFAGGIATALLGMFLHFFISFVIAAVFILSADRIPLLRRYAIPGSLLYGIGVFIVLNFIVLPLSAAPQLPPPTTFWFIEMVLEHIFIIGLPLGIIVRRSANA